MPDMPAKTSLQEAVQLAKEALGDVSPQEMADWIATNLGTTVQPVIVMVMLGSFLEKEHTDRIRLAALEMVEKAKAEQSMEKPKRREKSKANMGQAGLDAGSSRDHDPLSAPPLQCPLETGNDEKRHNPTIAKGCPVCGSADYVFRGRKKIAPKLGEEGSVETKHCCRACGHAWKIRAASN
jgi:hypothetical protein